MRIGTYDLIEQLGQGPHGHVHLAVDTVRDRMVAIKLFKSLEPLVSTDKHRDFEARVTDYTHVESPWFGTIFRASQRGEPPCFVAREYVNGITLASVRHHCPKLPLPFATAILHGVARGLQAVHDVGQVHGNLKLSNVLVQQAGGVKIVDPTIAAPLLAHSVSGMNLTTGLFGSPAFMAPEQLSSGEVTPATDAYGLGVLAYLLYCGRYPFEEPELGRLRRMKLQGDYPPALMLNPDLPEPLVSVVTDCLVRNPNQRAQSMSDVAERLREWLAATGASPARALLEGAQSISFVFMVGAITTPQRAAEPMPEPVTVPVDPPQPPTVPVGRSHPQVAAPAALEAPTVVVPPSEMEAAAASRAPHARPLPDTGPTPTRLRDTQTKMKPPVLFGVSEPIPAADPSTPAPADDTSGPGPAYLIAAGLIILAAVVWGAMRDRPEDKPVEDTSGPAVVDKIDPAVLLERARSDADGSPELALKSAREAVEALPNDGEARLLLGRALLRAGDWEHAREALERAEQLLPESLEPRRLLVRMLIDRKEADAAVAAARRALESHSTDGPLYVLLARALLLDRKPEAALEALDTAVALSPDSAEGWRLLGRTNTTLERHQAARKAFSRAIGLDSEEPTAYVGLARSLLALGRGGDATRLLQQGKKVVPESAPLHYAVGRILLLDGKIDEALVQLNDFTQRHPKDWRGWFALGQARLEKGNNSEAAKAFERSSTLRNQPEILHDMGVALARAGITNRALSAFSEAILLRYELWPSHCERARLYYQLNRIEEATRAFEDTLKLAPDNALAKAVLAAPPNSGLAHLQLGLPCTPRPYLDIPD